VAHKPETTYKLVEARDFPGSVLVAHELGIDTLVRKSVLIDFPARTEREVDEFSHQAEKTRENLNAATGGPLLRRKQSFRNIHHGLAIRNDEVVAYLTMADNASSKHNGPRGVAERQAKLRLTEQGGRDWIGHRYLWLGYAAMDQEVRDQIQQSPGKVNDLDVLIALSAEKRDPRQPVSTYPWGAEGDWKAELGSIGLEPDSNYQEWVSPFGSHADDVRQEHWTGASIAELTGAIYAKDEAEPAIEQARRQLQ